jgi:four helix bundle protein
MVAFLAGPAYSLADMSDYQNLQVWQKAHALAIHAHRTATNVRATRYSALRSQIIRASMSIPANIVEGRGQNTEREFARFLRYSLNSTYELEYHVRLACDIGVIPDTDADSLFAEGIEVRKMLHGLLKKLGHSTPPPPDFSKSKTRL